MFTPNSHYVQLFDSASLLADSVAEYITDGVARDEGILLVPTSSHWAQIRQRCTALGLDADAERASGRLAVGDAEDAAARLMVGDRPDWARFDAALGTLVRDHCARHRRVRVYGEVVDVLVRQSQFEAAATLEEYWNRLAEAEPFTLFCSYSSEHFGNPRDANVLRKICNLHSHVQTDTRDVLGTFLLKTHAAC